PALVFFPFPLRDVDEKQGKKGESGTEDTAVQKGWRWSPGFSRCWVNASPPEGGTPAQNRTRSENMASNIRNRIKGHRRGRAGDLVPHEWNYRDHPDEPRFALQALSEELGFARSLLA